MATYYTKEQMDNIASIIGTEVKAARSEVAENFNSFIDALNAAIGSTVEAVLEAYSNITIGTGTNSPAATNYSIQLNDDTNLTYNTEFQDLATFWQSNSQEFGGLAQMINIFLEDDFGALSFQNMSLETIKIKITPIESSMTSSVFFTNGDGNKGSDGSFTFLLAPMEESEL